MDAPKHVASQVLIRRLLVIVLWLVPATLTSAQSDGAEPPLLMDIRANEALMFGIGQETGSPYFDVPITELADDGVLIKLGYTQRGGELSFDIHHRAALSEEFGLPAEIMTVVEVITGSSNRMGTFTLLSTVDDGARSEEPLTRMSDAEVDRYVAPVGRRTVTLKTEPGPQSISIVGRELTISRAGFVTRVDTPGTRIAMVSNIHFEETRLGETLSFDEEP
jgi:hypothetical protein